MSEPYLPKYRKLMTAFFKEIASDRLKVRVMFTQNAHRPVGIPEDTRRESYFKLYYQFIKHAFGWEHRSDSRFKARLRVYFDQFPHTGHQVRIFRQFILGLNSSPVFRAANLTIREDDLAEVRSHDHVLLQCLDIVLGSMAFRLNDKHKAREPGQRVRGKKTRAKEQLYKSIFKEIEAISPRFKIGISTGTRGDPARRWHDAYRHWRFCPKEHDEFDQPLPKGAGKK